MGHTATSQRMIADIMIAELRSYSKALRQDERELFEAVLARSLKKMGAVSNAGSLHVWAFLLLSIIVEQEKAIAGQEKTIGAQEKRIIALERIVQVRTGADDGHVAHGRLQERGQYRPVDKDKSREHQD